MAMATPEQIADFVQRRITLGRVQPGANYYWVTAYPMPYQGPTLPTVEQIAGELVQHGEFRALQLGGFLNTPTGDFLEQAVAQAIPGALAPEFALTVAALKLAADLQQGESRSKAVLILVGGLLVGAILKDMSKAA